MSTRNFSVSSGPVKIRVNGEKCEKSVQNYQATDSFEILNKIVQKVFTLSDSFYNYNQNQSVQVRLCTKFGTLYFSWSQVCLCFFWNNSVNPSSIFSGQTSLLFVVPLRHSVYDSANLFQFHGPTQLIQLRKQEG